MKEFFDAFQLANKAHKNQIRKIDKTPYISHPMAVAFSLEKLGSRKELVIAGILHDVLEDTDVSPNEIEEKFGLEVLALVQAVSEDKKIKDWKERKARYIETVKNHSFDVKLLSAVDKLHNLYSISQDIAEIGDLVWSGFKAGKSEQRWFYYSLFDIFHSTKEFHESKILVEIGDLLRIVFEENIITQLPPPKDCGL